MNIKKIGLTALAGALVSFQQMLQIFQQLVQLQ